jgi:hypothetical protein
MCGGDMSQATARITRPPTSAAYTHFKEKQMLQTKYVTSQIHKLTLGSLLILGMLMVSTPGFSADKPETIEATAMGTSTQLGREFGITLNIYDYSTPADKQVLVQAFEKGQNQGLVNALTKMKTAGHIEVTGTLGFDCSYIQVIPTPTGRKIRFVTNRPLRFGEVSWDTRSSAYNLTAGEIDLNDTDKSKSTGVFYPEAEFSIDKQGELQINLIGNPWKFVDVLDYKGTPGVN